VNNLPTSLAGQLNAKYRKLTDVAHLFQGQRIITVLRNYEDNMFLKEALKIIKDASISEAKCADAIDFETVKDENGNLLSHIIIFMDDQRQIQNEIIQNLRNEEKITVVFLNDQYARESGELLLYFKT
jgi:hypothetical protein